MKKIFLILLLPFFVTSAEISGELNFIGFSSPIKIGSFVEAKILLGPNGEKYLSDLEKNVGKNLSEGFYLQEVRNPQVLQGGEDYLEADLTLVLISPLNTGTPTVWKVGEESIPLVLKGFLTEQPDLSPKGFIILEQAVKRNLFFIKLGIGLLVLLLIITGYFLWKRAKNKAILRKEEQKKRKKIDFWKSLIISADGRAQLERIYIEREIWLELIPSLRDRTKDFFSTIEKHQYRQSWTEVEHEEIKGSMESLKKVMHGI